MEFGVRGASTPITHRPPSARRPNSAHVNRNPITGEVFNTTPAVPQNANSNNNTHSFTPQVKPQSVPSLNLKYLHDKEETTGAIDVSLRDYNLESPGSASTVSWGTTALSGSSYRPDAQILHQKSARGSNVPGLPLGSHDYRSPSARVKTPKQPTAWDKAPVPEDLPASTAHHKELYQQYTNEIKQNFKTHSDPKQIAEEEVMRTMQAMKQKSLQHNDEMDESDDSDGCEDVGEDSVDEQWKKQRYTANQLRKKLDAEELMEHNKKLKLVETVMIDQLSRAVISDPEQDAQNRTQGGSTTRLAARGTNRYLHDSKITIRSTATEHLLSRRVCFGARIITRNGRDAVRELTGFFFHVDRSITVYEFKQFGKSAKAIPFVQRGIFRHATGPKEGLPYSLSDIYPGGDLLIPTEGQQALSAELSKARFLTLRVTDVDQDEKAELLHEEGGEYMGRNEAASRVAMENRHFLQQVQESAQEQIRKRGIKTITGLGRHYRQLDRNGEGVLLQHDLERGLLKFHIDLPPQVMEHMFEIVDPDGERRLDYCVFMRSVFGEMNEFRKSLVRKAFSKVDTHKQGCIHLSDIKKFFNANCPYKPNSDADTAKNMLQAFLEAVRTSDRQEEVSFTEFEEYYEGLSLGLDNDQDFANILRNTWNI